MEHVTKTKGDLAEAVALKAFVQAGYLVSLPFSENTRYDMIIDNKGSLLKVQVKTASLRNGVLKFNTRRVSKYVNEQYKLGEIDLFAVYSPDLDQLYTIPWSPTLGCIPHFRISAPKNNQIEAIQWAKDFEFNGSIPSVNTQTDTVHLYSPAKGD